MPQFLEIGLRQFEELSFIRSSPLSLLLIYYVLLLPVFPQLVQYIDQGNFILFI